MLDTGFRILSYNISLVSLCMKCGKYTKLKAWATMCF